MFPGVVGTESRVGTSFPVPGIRDVSALPGSSCTVNEIVSVGILLPKAQSDRSSMGKKKKKKGCFPLQSDTWKGLGKQRLKSNLKAEPGITARHVQPDSYQPGMKLRPKTP